MVCLFLLSSHTQYRISRYRHWSQSTVVRVWDRRGRLWSLRPGHCFSRCYDTNMSLTLILLFLSFVFSLKTLQRPGLRDTQLNPTPSTKAWMFFSNLKHLKYMELQFGGTSEAPFIVALFQFLWTFTRLWVFSSIWFLKTFRTERISRCYFVHKPSVTFALLLEHQLIRERGFHWVISGSE